MQKALLSALLASTVVMGLAHAAENWMPLGQGSSSKWFINSDMSMYGSAKRVEVKSVPTMTPPPLNGQKVLYNITTMLVDCKYNTMQQISSAYYGETGMLQKKETPLGPGNELVPVDGLSPQHKSIFAWTCAGGQLAQAPTNNYPTPTPNSYATTNTQPASPANNNDGINPDDRTHPVGSLMTEQQAIDNAGTAIIILDYSTVVAGNDFPVRIGAVSKIDPQTSYMYLVPANLPHKDEKLAGEKRLTYHNVGEMQADGTQGILTFDAPNQHGLYDLRMFDRGQEISTVTFAVGDKDIRNFNPGSPPQ